MLKFDWNFLWTLINLVVFFVLMRVFLFKPIKRTLDKRNELIQKQLDDAKEVSEQADEKLADYEQKLANAASEGDKIISDAKDSAKLEYNKIIDRAEADALELRADAMKQIEAEKDAARRAAKEEITSLAIQTAEKVLGASVSAETDSDIFDEFLKENNYEGSVD